MRKLLFFILLLPALFFGQFHLFNGSDTLTAAGDSTSASYYMPQGGFNGLLGLALDVDNGKGTTDTVSFYPQYNILGDWVTGSIITWNVNSGNSDFSTTQTTILPQTADSTDLFILIIDPNTTDNINGFPWQEFRVKMTNTNTSNFVVRLWLYAY